MAIKVLLKILVSLAVYLCINVLTLKEKLTYKLLKFKLTFCIEVLVKGASSDTIQAKLKRDLLTNYDKDVRPKLEHTNTTKVLVRMLIKFLSYEPISDTLSVSSWMSMAWTDDHLRWTVSDYEGIEFTHLSSDLIWTPDFSLYNGVNHNEATSSLLNGVGCIVYNTGHIMCVPPVEHNGMCVADMTYYPYDKQNCTLRYGSWVHTGEELNITLQNEPITMDEYIPNGHYDVVSINVTRNTGRYKCCPNSTYPSLSYRFILKRHASIFTCNIVVPAIVMMVMSLLTLCMESTVSERFSLIYVNFICHYLYIQYVSWEIPLSGLKPPLILIYSRDSLIIIMLSLILTVFNRNISCTVRETPYWLSRTIAIIVTSKPGSILFFLDSSLKNVAAIKMEEDGANIIESPDSQKTKDWLYLTKILDQIFLIIIFIIYFCMFIAFIP